MMNFEMWIIKRILGIAKNEDVLREASLERALFDETIKCRKIGYLKYILRVERYGIRRLVMEGKTEGERRISRESLSWLRIIRQWTGIKDIGGLCRAEKDSKQLPNYIQ